MNSLDIITKTSVSISCGSLGVSTMFFPHVVYGWVPHIVFSSYHLIGKLGHQIMKLEISTAPTKAKSRESAYSQTLNQSKIDRLGLRSRDGQTAMVDGVWS